MPIDTRDLTVIAAGKREVAAETRAKKAEARVAELEAHARDVLQRYEVVNDVDDELARRLEVLLVAVGRGSAPSAPKGPIVERRIVSDPGAAIEVTDCVLSPAARAGLNLGNASLTGEARVPYGIAVSDSVPVPGGHAVTVVRPSEASPVEMFAPSNDPKTTAQLTTILALRKMSEEQRPNEARPDLEYLEKCTDAFLARRHQGRAELLLLLQLVHDDGKARAPRSETAKPTSAQLEERAFRDGYAVGFDDAEGSREAHREDDATRCWLATRTGSEPELRRCHACFESKPCPSSVCEHPDRVMPKESTE